MDIKCYCENCELWFHPDIIEQSTGLGGPDNIDVSGTCPKCHSEITNEYSAT